MKRRKTKIKNISQNIKECEPIIENKVKESPQGNVSYQNSLNRVRSLELIEERLEALEGFCMYYWVMQSVQCRLSCARTVLSLIFQVTNEGTDKIMIPTYIFTKYTLCTENTVNRNIKWLQNQGFIFIDTKKNNIGNGNERYYSINMDKVQPLIEQYKYSITNATNIIYRMSKKQLQIFMVTLNDYIPLIEVDDSFQDASDDDVCELLEVFNKLSLRDKAEIMTLIAEQFENSISKKRVKFDIPESELVGYNGTYWVC